MSLRVELAADGERLRIEFPSGHSVESNAQGAGWLLQRLLREREIARAEGEALKVGMEGEPLQSMVDGWLKAGGQIKKVQRLKAPPEGITLEEIFE